MTIREKEHIRETISWYENTDGSEREDASHEMYNILKGLLKKEERENILHKEPFEDDVDGVKFHKPISEEILEKTTY